MSLAIKPTDPMERIEEETRKEIQNELEKDLAAMGIAVSAYFVELWGLSEKEKEKLRWEKALQRLAERKREEGKKPWDRFKGEGGDKEVKTVAFYTITPAGVEEVDVAIEEEEEGLEKAVDAALLERSPEPVEEAAASPLIEPAKAEEALEVVKEGKEGAVERAMDILVVESPANIEVAMVRKAELERVIEKREETLRELLKKAKEEGERAVREWIEKHLPPLLRAKYLLLLNKLGLDGVRKAATRDLEVLMGLKERLRRMGVKEIVRAARRAGRRIASLLKRLFGG